MELSIKAAQFYVRETPSSNFSETKIEGYKVVGGVREIVLARELTKIHEEFWRGSINEAIALYNQQRQPKGELL